MTTPVTDVNRLRPDLEAAEQKLLDLAEAEKRVLEHLAAARARMMRASVERDDLARDLAIATADAEQARADITQCAVPAPPAVPGTAH